MNPENHTQNGDRDFKAPKTGFWGGLLNRRKNEPQVVEPKKQVEIDNNEVDGLEPENWRELQQMLNDHDAEGWRERGLFQIYGKERIDGLGAFMDGERDFDVNEDGSIRRSGFNKLKEFGHKILGTLVNKKNLGGAVALVGVAVVTGGVGAPAAMALAGGAVGRGVVEAWHSINGEERKLREKRASLSYEQYNKLQAIVTEIDNAAPDSPEATQLQAELLQCYQESNTELDQVTGEILKLKDNWNRRRNIGQFIGAIAGAGAGIAQGFQHLSERALTVNLDGNGVAHHVEKIGGVWHFLYNSPQEAAQAASQGAHLVSSAAGHAAHVLGAGSNMIASQVAQNIIPEVGKLGAVFGGMIVGRFLDRKDVQKEYNTLAENQAVRPEASAPEVDMGTSSTEANTYTPGSGESWSPPDQPINTEMESSPQIEPIPQPVVEEPVSPPEKAVNNSIINLESIASFVHKNELESRETYLDSMRKTTEILRNRGAIVELRRGVPSIIIPDIHGRRLDFAQILGQRIHNQSVLDLLKKGEINIVCLGDGMHSENPDNWNLSNPEALKNEMVRSMGVMKMIMDLKIAYPESFHYLRGNHDEINGSFMKSGVFISQIMHEGIKNAYGEDFLNEYAQFEEAMPLVAHGEHFVASHSAPDRAYSREEIEQRGKAVSKGLRWTDNQKGGSSEQAVRGVLENLGEKDGLYIVGHRIVSEEKGFVKYDFHNKMMQVNNDEHLLYTMIGPDGKEEVRRLRR